MGAFVGGSVVGACVVGDVVVGARVVGEIVVGTRVVGANGRFGSNGAKRVGANETGA